MSMLTSVHAADTSAFTFKPARPHHSLHLNFSSPGASLSQLLAQSYSGFPEKHRSYLCPRFFPKYPFFFPPVTIHYERYPTLYRLRVSHAGLSSFLGYFNPYELSFPLKPSLRIRHSLVCQQSAATFPKPSTTPRKAPIASITERNVDHSRKRRRGEPHPSSSQSSSKPQRAPSRGSKTLRQLGNKKLFGNASVLINGSPKERRAYMDALQRGEEHMSLLELNEVATTLCRMRRVNSALALVELWEKKPLCDQLASLKSVKSFTIMIDVYGKAQQLSRALSLFYNMPRLGAEPNIITYNAIISACARNNEPDLAYQVFQEMQENGLVPDKYTYGSLIDSCSKSGQVERAFDVYRLMDANDIGKDPTIYSTLIDACSRAQQLERAFTVFEEMKRQGVWPNLVTFTVLIGMCANAKQPERAFQLFSEIKHWNIRRANVVTYTALIEACAKAGWPQRAEMVMAAMMENGIRPNEISYGALMDGWTRCGRIDKAFEIIDRMANKHRLTPNAVVIGSLIESCKKTNNISRAKAIWGLIVQHNIRPTPCNYPPLIVMAARNGDTGVAMAIVMHAYARGSLRRVSVRSENPTLRSLAFAITYLERLVREMRGRAEDKEKYIRRLKVVFGSTAMRADDTEGISSQKLLELGSLDLGSLELGSVE
eukprot:GFKZ01004260.1.p1 GENE.GFKZ01004260.1~~GFKZ01004260.1.p1  ORF type:complete len:656 (-),score=50.99 GFKZ01004260.1:383-2350(-)